MTKYALGFVGSVALFFSAGAKARDEDSQNALCKVAAVSAAKSAAEIDTQGFQGAFYLYSIRDLGSYQYKVLVRAGDMTSGYLAPYRIDARFDAATQGCVVTAVTAL